MKSCQNTALNAKNSHYKKSIKSYLDRKMAHNKECSINYHGSFGGMQGAGA